MYLVALNLLKFMFSKKTTKIDEILAFDLTVYSKCQIDGEDFVKFCDLLRKHELYISRWVIPVKGPLSTEGQHSNWRWARERAASPAFWSLHFFGGRIWVSWYCQRSSK